MNPPFHLARITTEHQMLNWPRALYTGVYPSKSVLKWLDISELHQLQLSEQNTGSADLEISLNQGETDKVKCKKTPKRGKLDAYAGFSLTACALIFLNRCEICIWYNCALFILSEWIKNVLTKWFYIQAEFGAVQTAAEGQIFSTVSVMLGFQICFKQ